MENHLPDPESDREERLEIGHLGVCFRDLEVRKPLTEQLCYSANALTVQRYSAAFI